MAILTKSTVLVLIIAAGCLSLDDPTVSERMHHHRHWRFRTHY